MFIGITYHDFRGDIFVHIHNWVSISLSKWSFHCIIIYFIYLTSGYSCSQDEWTDIVQLCIIFILFLPNLVMCGEYVFNFINYGAATTTLTANLLNLRSDNRSSPIGRIL